MKKNLKKLFDDITVDDIPEGRESEYYTKEQSYELIKRVKQLLKFLVVFSSSFVILIILAILKLLIDFPSWFNIFIYVFVVLVLISIIIGIVMYVKFFKFAKEISKEEVPIKTE